jgi:hypothetical protein
VGGVVVALAGRAAAEPPRAAACFGGPVTALATGEKGASGATLSGDSLYWVIGGDVRRMVLKTKAISSAAELRGAEVKVLDARIAVGSNNINQLEAVDFASRKDRVLVDGQPFMDEAILFSSLALDAKYVYFGRDEDPYPFKARPQAGFYRVRREGAGAPERLADSPDGYTEFVLVDGYVYFRRKRPDLQLVRRRVQANAPVEVIAPTHYAGRGSIAIHAGRVYWDDRGGIFSAPITGGAPVQHVATGNLGAVDLLADDACVYWVNGTGAVLRAQGQGGVAERIGSVEPPREGDRQPHHELASDGTYLYWADGTTGNIQRAGRSAATTTAEVLTIAAKLTTGQPAREMGAGKLILGGGWGCVRLVRQGGSQLQCWRAPGEGKAKGAPMRAQPVPWLDVDEYAGSADRLCALVGQEARCWTAAELFGPAPRNAPPKSATGKSIYDPEIAAGSGFACTAKAKIWTCSGDDSYGQLGKGTAAAPGDRLYGANAALGAAHGCVVDSSSVRCWGRNDTLQLGFSSAETCRVGPKEVPCSRAAQPPSFPLPQGVGITTTDTYTCAQRGSHHCWGASRDGLFGTAAECPPGLRGAFPTRSGTVAAPNATCSAKPAELPAFPEKEEPRTYRLAIGPRGACGITGNEVRCAGAIPTPPGLKQDAFASAAIAVSSGDDASACVVQKGGVSCWGAAYSPAASPTQMTRIEFAEVAAGGPAVDGAPPEKGWPQQCAVAHACESRALAACPAGSPAPAASWSALLARGGASDGAAVTLSGPLLVQAPGGPDPPPEKYRCPFAEPLPIVIGDAKNPLVLDGFTCAGDPSRRCCAAPALGQNVVVKGKLASAGARWILRNPELCAPR